MDSPTHCSLTDAFKGCFIGALLIGGHSRRMGERPRIQDHLGKGHPYEIRRHGLFPDRVELIWDIQEPERRYQDVAGALHQDRPA